MKLTEVFPSNYIKADDLQGHDVPVVIASAKIEQLGTDNKLVLYFQNKTKGMVCNKTNAGRISYLYGDDTDGWVGKEVVLTSEFVEFQGRTVKGLRVRPPAPRQAPPAHNGPVQFQERKGYTVSTTTRPPDPLPEEPPAHFNDPIPF